MRTTVFFYEISQISRSDVGSNGLPLPDQIAHGGNVWKVESLQVIKTDLAHLQSDLPTYYIDLIKWTHLWVQAQVFQLYNSHIHHVAQNADVARQDIANVAAVAEQDMVIVNEDQYDDTRDKNSVERNFPDSDLFDTSENVIKSRSHENENQLAIDNNLTTQRLAVNTNKTGDEKDNNMASNTAELTGQAALMSRLGRKCTVPQMKRNEKGRMTLPDWASVFGPNGTKPKVTPIQVSKRYVRPQMKRKGASDSSQDMHTQIGDSKIAFKSLEETSTGARPVMFTPINRRSSILTVTDHDDIRFGADDEEDLQQSPASSKKVTAPRKPRRAKVVPGMAVFSSSPSTNHDDTSHKVLAPSTPMPHVSGSTTPPSADDTEGTECAGSTEFSKSPRPRSNRVNSDTSISE